MLKRILGATFAAAFLVTAAGSPIIAQEKTTTPQQQKMKDCAAKWKTEKAEKKVSGREAYRKFIGECLKS